MTARPTAATVALALAIACQPEPVDDLLLVPAVVAETSAPLSHDNEIALTHDTTACVVDSFELQVGCELHHHDPRSYSVVQ